MDDSLAHSAFLPVRGLIPLHMASGARLGDESVRRAMRLNRIVFKNLKIDLAVGEGGPQSLLPLLEFAASLDLRVSLRTTQLSTISESLASLKSAGLLDLLLVTSDLAHASIARGLSAAEAAGLACRVQLEAPWCLPESPNNIETLLSSEPVKCVHFTIGDFLSAGHARPPVRNPSKTLDQLQDLAAALQSRGIETNFIGFPRGALRAALCPCAKNRAQFFSDYQHYNQASYLLANALFARSPGAGAYILDYMLTRETSRLSQLDNFILRLTLHKHPGAVDFLADIHRAVRLVAPLPGLPKRVQNLPEQSHGSGTLEPDLQTRFDEWFPDLNTIDDNDLDDMPAASRPRYLDEVECGRRGALESRKALARHALDLVDNTPHTREITASEYSASNAHTIELPGAHRWFSVANVEKRSSPLARLSPPLTLCATFGGGGAEYIGFGYGRHARILCPMDDAQHRLTLHVAGDGAYVLLRDNEIVEPASFAGDFFVPERIGSRVEPSLVLWNINKEIVTQSVLIWETHDNRDGRAGDVEFSVVIVSTRYARRLQAALLSIARQQDFDLSKIEVIVAYVPGLDANEDVMDSVGAAYPALSIVRAPFSARDALAKGYLINESVRLAQGEWAVVMDSDIILPPGMFSALHTRAGGAHFIAPGGRKMLDRETTAKILLGEINPSECWEALLNGPGELRKREAGGLPIGYFQCVRKSCFEKVQYEELPHFEGADWRFAQSIREVFGPELWLDDIPVQHLDHGGSHWYGTRRHY